MKITVFGKGNVGGGLADLWEAAGHKVARLGRNGGEAGDADAVLIAVPGKAIAEAIGKLSGIQGKTVIDATNRFGVRSACRLQFQRRIH
jgi:8-hydroxy-5-deazaflavin:NADPH oxidoreductase